MVISNESVIEIFGLKSKIFKSFKDLSNDYLRDKNGKIRPLKIFQKWRSRFKFLYKKSDLNLDLYIKQSYISLLAKFFIFNKIFSKKFTDNNDITRFILNLKNKGIKIFLEDLFHWNTRFNELNSNLNKEISKIKLIQEDIFGKIYHDILSTQTRHMLGEFYTPPELARLMINKTYKFGQKVLDPNCGSGIFIIEVILKVLNADRSKKEKYEALNNIYGFDINPIAILIVKANILLILIDFKEEDFPINVYLLNSLFITEKNDLKIPKFDLIIGNPPWIVLKSINSKKYKNKIKEEARKLDIMRGGKYSTSLGMSSIIFERCSRYFLKRGGIIFFIITNGIMNGAQHAKFRFFKNLSNITIWRFSEDIFRINNICLKAKKLNEPIKKRLKIEVIDIDCEHFDNTWNFKFQKPKIYIPYNYSVISQKNSIVKRFIPLKEIKNLLPQKQSLYSKRFYQGASIVPRNLFFVDIVSEINENLVEIKPNMGFQSKKPWNKRPFDKSKVNAKYIFNIAKSSELIPFKLLRTFNVFLPIEKNDYNYYPEKLEPLSKSHFDFINNFYRNTQKKGAKIKNLWDQINHLNKLTNQCQKSKIKVIYNGIGSIVKSAILRNSEVIDTSLYYFSTKNLNEAYYLIAILNSPSITKSVKLSGSIGASGSLRNIHKHPLDFPIPLFSSDNDLHLILSNKGKKIETLVLKLIQDWLEKEKSKNSKSKKENKIVKIKARSIKNYVLRSKAFQKEISSLDYLVKKIIINQNKIY
ncbi:MAG: N-6 DNA methylase [Candidatus Lokiarchaeota archaeon]|nr:N-6 DNA methylase [Candidatus Lokiarchaeota archaeon]